MPKKLPPSLVKLRYPPAYPFSCMANRFSLDHEEGFTVAHFGLVNRSGLLLDRFTCVFPKATLLALKENLLQYSDKLGPSKKQIAAWTPPSREVSGEWTLAVIDFVHLCNWDDAHAEICFWNYSQAYAADMVRDGKKEELMTWGVALIRCEIDLQRAFLAELYDDAV